MERGVSFFIRNLNIWRTYNNYIYVFKHFEDNLKKIQQLSKFRKEMISNLIKNKNQKQQRVIGQIYNSLNIFCFCITTEINLLKIRLEDH